MLPGLDGTGLMFEPFLQQHDSDYEWCIEVLFSGQDKSMDDQVNHIESHYHGQSIYLLAESYSGRIAYELLIRKKLTVKAVIFVASFVSRPSLLTWFSPLIPFSWIKKGWFPKRWVTRLLFDAADRRDLLDVLLKSIGSVDNLTLHARLNQLKRMQRPETTVATPCLYLKPQKDRWVAERCVQEVTYLFEDCELVQIAGTYFLLQTNPRACQQAIFSFLQRMTSISCKKH